MNVIGFRLLLLLLFERFVCKFCFFETRRRERETFTKQTYHSRTYARLQQIAFTDLPNKAPPMVSFVLIAHLSCLGLSTKRLSPLIRKLLGKRLPERSLFVISTGAPEIVRTIRTFCGSYLAFFKGLVYKTRAFGYRYNTAIDLEAKTNKFTEHPKPIAFPEKDCCVCVCVCTCVYVCEERERERERESKLTYHAIN